MQFTAVVLSFAALAAAQDTVWVTETVIGTDCAPTGYPTVPAPYPSSNGTTTHSVPAPVPTPTYTPVNPPSNVTSTTGGVPEYPTSPPTESLPPTNGAGALFPASGIALAGALAAIMAIIA